MIYLRFMGGGEAASISFVLICLSLDEEVSLLTYDIDADHVGRL